LPALSIAIEAKVDHELPLVGVLTHWADMATVTTQVALLLPSWVDTVIVALPEATAVTTAAAPVAETVATAALLLDQVRLWLVAFAGTTVVVSETVWPRPIVAVEMLKLTPVTETTTVTAQVAVLPPSTVVTVMIAVPAATALTRPELETVATLALLADQVTARFVALTGKMLAVRRSVLPVEIWSVVLSRATLVTATGAVVVAVWVPVADPLTVLVELGVPVPVPVRVEV
jgi:hypothetical protein